MNVEQKDVIEFYPDGDMDDTQIRDNDFNADTDNGDINIRFENRIDRRKKKTIRKSAFHSDLATIIYMVGGVYLLMLVISLAGLFIPGTALDTWYMNVDDDGYSLIVCGLSAGILLLLYRRWNPGLWSEMRAAKKRRMTAQMLIIFIIIHLTLDAAAGFLDPVYEAFFNLFGVSASAEQEIATAASVSVIGVLYGDFLAPIFEETVFRGLIRQSLERYGKWFAIFTSALLFGIMHGNIAQFLSAFLGGILYGYVATEYGIKWSIFLHMFWNGIMGDVLSLIADDIPEIPFYLGQYILLGIGVIYLAVHRRQMLTYREQNAPEKGVRKVFYTSPWFYILLAVWIYEVVEGLVAV